MPASAINILPGPTVQVYSVTQPAAGAAISYTVPAGHAQSILGLSCTYAASAHAGHRSPLITMSDANGNILMQNAISSSYISPTQTATFTFSSAADALSLTGPLVFNTTIPTRLVVPPLGTITITATNLDVADQFSAIVVEMLDYIAM